MQTRYRRSFEWPTLALVVLCHAGWLASVTILPGVSLVLAMIVCALMITLHSSLQHETVHGTTLINPRISDFLVALPVGLLIPFGRFKATHLDHHRDSRLTDPYDDPETNFVDPAVWEAMGPLQRRILGFNNTLLGRLVIGPAVGMMSFWRDDLRKIRAGDRAVARDWLGHGCGLVVLAALLWAIGTMPVWAYLVCAYIGLSILKIRTYLEHRAHADAAGRTVIIEDRGVLALLFLNNNFHAVHHTHPGMPWYLLPRRYAEARDAFLDRNDGYRFASYGEVFRRYFLKRKDPVPHPLWRRP